jgi:ATP-dependent DNA helicase RecG
MREDEYTEFKREPTKQVAREVIAFANTHGGTLYLGVDDDGVPVGITDVDAAMLVVVNSVRDSVAPDVMPLIQVSVLSGEECEDLFGSVPKSGAVVRLAVGEGRRKPYCLARKGPVPEGVFVREGPSTASADSGRILEMIMESSQTSFEDLPAGEDDLTFDSLRKSFS